MYVKVHLCLSKAGVYGVVLCRWDFLGFPEEIRLAGFVKV